MRARPVPDYHLGCALPAAAGQHGPRGPAGPQKQHLFPGKLGLIAAGQEHKAVNIRIISRKSCRRRLQHIHGADQPCGFVDGLQKRHHPLLMRHRHIESGHVHGPGPM